jgi:hypothetical protein
MTLRVPRLPFSVDPLIAEARRRARQRRLVLALVALALAGGAVGTALALRGSGRTGPSVKLVAPVAKAAVQHIGSGPFVLSGGFAGGGGSGLWGDGASGPHGTSLGCVDRRHYSEAFGIENRSKAPVTLTAAHGPNPAPRFIDLVAIQLRLSPPRPHQRQANWGWDGDLDYRAWSAAATRPVTIPPGRIATVQSNFLMRHCHELARGRSIVVPGWLVLSYRASGHLQRKKVPLAAERIVLGPGPTRSACEPVSGSSTLVAADTGCEAARRAALACHPMSHNSWGDCTVAGVYWDCGSTAGAGSPYLETCYLPRKKSRWFRVRWNPPVLSGNAIGGVRFGLPRRKVVTRLSELLGTRSPTPPRNDGCGPVLTEVAWQHLYVELRRGRLTGFRYIENGWPGASGKRSISSALPPLVTTKGVTLGDTLAQARAAYGHLTPVGTNRWRAPDGLILWDDARDYPDPPSSRIVEIEYGACGDF